MIVYPGRTCLRRGEDNGVLDIVGAQMADGVAGSIATGLEVEVSEVKRKQQEEEDRRLGRIKLRQQQFSNKTVLGVQKVGPPTAVDPTSSTLVATEEDGADVTMMPMGDGAIEDPDGLRVDISKEMKQKLQAFMEKQVRHAS